MNLQKIIAAVICAFIVCTVFSACRTEIKPGGTTEPATTGSDGVTTADEETAAGETQPGETAAGATEPGATDPAYDETTTEKLRMKKYSFSDALTFSAPAEWTPSEDGGVYTLVDNADNYTYGVGFMLAAAGEDSAEAIRSTFTGDSRLVSATELSDATVGAGIPAKYFGMTLENEENHGIYIFSTTKGVVVLDVTTIGGAPLSALAETVSSIELK